MFDIAITEDGDLRFDTTNTDLYAIGSDALRVQMAICRIKSIKKDWYEDNIGADLEEIIGLANTTATQNLGANKILGAVTLGGLFDSSEIYIVAESVNRKTEINYSVYLKNLNQESATLVEVDLDLIKGINVRIGE